MATRDAFVARLNATLTTLSQATYLGGSGDDDGLALAIHPTSGDVFVAGHDVFDRFSRHDRRGAAGVRRRR